MPNKIILRVHKAPEVKEDLIGTIKITPEAERIIRQLRLETGLSGRHIASEMIVQGAEFIKVEVV